MAERAKFLVDRAI